MPRGTQAAPIRPGLAPHGDVDSERLGYAEQRQVAGHAHGVVVDLLDRIRDEGDRWKPLYIEKRPRAQIVVDEKEPTSTDLESIWNTTLLLFG